MSATRPCEHCGAPIPASARSHAMFCSGRCKVAAYRARGTVTPKQTVTPKAAKPETVTEQTVTATACFDAGTVTEPGISVTELNYATPESVTSVDFIEPVTLSKPVIDVPESVTEAETVTPKAGSVTEAVRPKPIPAGYKSWDDFHQTVASLRRHIAERAAKGALAATLIARAA